MLGEYWLDRKLTDTDLHIRMNFQDHAREMLELSLNSGTSFLVSVSKGVPAIGLLLR